MLESFAISYLVANIAARDKMKSIRDMVSLWKTFKENMGAETASDLISVMLTAGRIMDVSIVLKTPDDVMNYYASIKKEVDKAIPKERFDMSTLAAAYLTSRYVSATKKIETIREMIDIFETFEKNIIIADDSDFVATILLSYRMQDELHNIKPEDIRNLVQPIKELL